MMAPLPTTAHVHMTAKKTLYLANAYGFSAQQRGGPLHELVRALESMGADVWEPFARNNQIDRASAGWAYQIGQADLRDVRAADGLLRWSTAVRRMRASWWSWVWRSRGRSRCLSIGVRY